MNTALMDAYEAVAKILIKRGDEDPQAESLREVMDVLWRKMDADEISILQRRGAEHLK